MPLLSVITPEYAPTAEHAGETIAGVAEQHLPGGWELEWIVQEDGDNPQLHSVYEEVEAASYEANNAQYGVAMTRNLALGRAAGELVQVLDHDDVLLPGALSTLIGAFEDRSIHWAVGQADDLMPSGERRSYPSALPYGLVRAGEANNWASLHRGNWPIHCAGLMVRSDTMRAIGGYPALPADDDIAMFAGLSELADGYNFPETTWLYRISPDSLSRTEGFRSHSVEGRTFALERAVAIRALRLEESEPFAEHGEGQLVVNVGPAIKG